MKIFVGAILAVVFRVGLAQLSNDCQDACNIAFCFDSSDSIWPDDYMKMRDTIHHFNQITLGANASLYRVGFAIYAQTTEDDRTCYMYPPQTHDSLKQCTNSAFNPLIRERESSHLQECLKLLNSNPRFWLGVNPKCTYRIVVLTDGNTSNMEQAAHTALLLRRKGVRIICYTLGFVEEDYDYRHEYNRICDESYKIKDCQTFYDEIETVLRVIKCDEIKDNPVGVCDDCTVYNNVGYKVDPADCSCWLQCINNSKSEFDVTRQCCPCDMFWNNELLSCVPAKGVDCFDDPCLGRNVASYRFQDNCRMHWVCENHLTDKTACCKKGEKYDSDMQACVPDPTNECKHLCPCQEYIPPPVVIYPCHSEPNPGDPYSYLIRVFPGFPPFTMACALGTIYDHTTCGCIHDPNPRPIECRPELLIQCTEDPLIDHGKNVSIENQGVSVDTKNGFCFWDGQSRLTVHRFANMDWGENLALCVSFFGFPGAENTDISLVHNTDCDETASIELMLKRHENHMPYVQATIITTNTKVDLQLEYREFEINKLFLTYNGAVVKFSIEYADGIVDSVSSPATGRIWMVECGLQLGYGSNSYYIGHMHDICVYRDCIPDDFHPQKTP